MKNLLALLNSMLLVLALVFAINMYLKADEMEKELRAVQVINDTRIEELSKEIRVLKTDIDVIQYGFDEK